jgi:hypothetical protein
MSMNLKCHEIDLIQTPTNITRMCLYAKLPDVDKGKGKGKKSPWRTVKEKYLMRVTEEWGNKLQQWDVVENERAKLERAEKWCGRLTFEEV